MHRIAIAGGGITGLSALHWVKKRAPEAKARLFEKESRTGGWIDTTQYSDVPSVFELGPRSLRAASGADTLNMVQELGLESEVIVPSRVSKVRLIFHEGQVQRLPNSPIGLLTSDLIRPKALSFLKDLFVTKAKVDKWNAANNGDDDVSIHDFISRHFGAELSEDIIAGVVVGIYAGNAKRLSAKSCFSSLHSVEQNHGSLIRGILSGKGVKKSARASDLARRIKASGGVFSFKDGLSVLSKKISSIYHEDIVRGDGLEALEFSGGGKEVNVKLSSGSTFTADTLISALPAYEIARLLKLHDTELAQMLESIEFASVAVITMTFDNHGDESNVIPKELHGFGYLVPPKYQEPVLGVVFDSLTFPQQQSSELTRVTVMIGGDLSNHAKVPDVTSMTDEQLTTVSREALQRHLGINQAPMATHVKVCKNGIAQYTVGHEKKIEKISQLIADKFPALKVAGSSYYGVGVNDCVRSTRTIVDSIKF